QEFRGTRQSPQRGQVFVTGQKDDADVRGLRQDPLRRLRPVQMRHLQIHDDDVRSELLRQVDRLSPVLRLADDLDVGLTRELGGQQPAQQGGVVRNDCSDGRHDRSDPLYGVILSPDRTFCQGMTVYRIERRNLTRLRSFLFEQAPYTVP